MDVAAGEMLVEEPDDGDADEEATRSRLHSWPPRDGGDAEGGRKQGAERWMPEETEREQDQAYSRQSLAMVRDSVRIFRTALCHVALFFVPRSGRVRCFSTAGTAVQLLQFYSAIQGFTRSAKARLHSDGFELWRKFSDPDGGAPWLEDALMRLSAVGVSQVTLKRFHAAYNRVILRYMTGPDGLRADVGRELDSALSWIIDQLDTCADAEASFVLPARSAGSTRAAAAAPAAASPTAASPNPTNTATVSPPSAPPLLSTPASAPPGTPNIAASFSTPMTNPHDFMALRAAVLRGAALTPEHYRVYASSLEYYAAQQQIATAAAQATPANMGGGAVTMAQRFGYRGASATPGAAASAAALGEMRMRELQERYMRDAQASRDFGGFGYGGGPR